MESLTGLSKTGEGPASSNEENVDRIVLRRTEQARLEAWLKKLNAQFEGMVRITKSDLANFLIRHHHEELSDLEISQLETDHYDEVRWLNWALAKIREAKRQGLVLTLDELMAKRLVNAGTKKTPQKRARKNSSQGNANSNAQMISLQNSIEK